MARTLPEKPHHARCSHQLALAPVTPPTLPTERATGFKTSDQMATYAYLRNLLLCQRWPLRELLVLKRVGRHRQRWPLSRGVVTGAGASLAAERQAAWDQLQVHLLPDLI